MRKHSILCLLLLAALAACSQPEKPPYTGIKIGKPYQIYGRWYKPQYNSHYDETGTASWYGPGFHGGHTASGERFDQNAMTAAHRTLPLPSIVRVTNLENGKSALVKVNDRGPFAHDRIIDLSRGAALQLGIVATGTAQVRVQFLDKETKEYVQNSVQGTQYAMRNLRQVNPDEAGARQEAGQMPQLQIEARMFAEPPAADITADTSPTLTTAKIDPIPAPIHETSEPPPMPNTVETTTIFSIIDNAEASPALPAFTPSVPVQPQGGFYIQAGTFGLKANAYALRSKLGGMGPSQIMETETHNHMLYRVLLGPYNLESDARNQLSKLAEIGISDGKITHN